MVVILVTEVETFLDYFGFAGALMDGDCIVLRLSVLGDKTGRRLTRKKILEDSCPSACGGRNLNNKN
jgi:hypothetical protein